MLSVKTSTIAFSVKCIIRRNAEKSLSDGGVHYRVSSGCLCIGFGGIHALHFSVSFSFARLW